MIKIGKFTIVRVDDDDVWITHEDGEGGRFPIALLEESIAEFFANNF